jgi:hypothetical protein
MIDYCVMFWDDDIVKALVIIIIIITQYLDKLKLLHFTALSRKYLREREDRCFDQGAYRVPALLSLVALVCGAHDRCPIALAVVHPFTQ